ncbi:hypothetical protein EG68_01535 [Paragonimus skrjabini miyazakii]|uniref:Uncharacterized protein n=1 Tax=Paragonimus skrjabini miyazakii TaxID=59628 RepID=A0A8S9Z277_9TREM|nr:hypothetical protein EG68_01535 [Paragonimus skrjabini miyazakii]
MNRRLAVVTPLKSPSTQQLTSECSDYVKQARFTSCLNDEHQRCSSERMNKPEQNVRACGCDHSLSSLPNCCNRQFNSAHFEPRQGFSHLTTSQTQVAADNLCSFQPPGPSTLCSPSFNRARLPKDFVGSQQFESAELSADVSTVPPILTEAEQLNCIPPQPVHRLTPHHLHGTKTINDPPVLSIVGRISSMSDHQAVRSSPPRMAQSPTHSNVNNLLRSGYPSPKLAQAVSDYQDPTNPAMLSFSKGDLITVLGLSDMSQSKEPMFRGHLVTQDPYKFIGLIPPSLITFCDPVKPIVPTKIKVDVSTQTECASDVVDDYSSETDCSDSSEPERSASPPLPPPPPLMFPSVIVASPISSHPYPGEPRRFSTTSQTAVPSVTYATLGSDVLGRTTTTRSVLFPASDAHTCLLPDGNKRNSATSLDSGRDSTYAGSNESNGGNTTGWSRPLATAIEKNLLMNKNSPSRVISSGDCRPMDLTIPPGPSTHGCDGNRLNQTESEFLCRPNTDRLVNAGSMCCSASRLSSDPLTPTLSAPRSVSASLQTSCPDYASVKHNQLDPVPSPISQEVNCAFYRVQPPDSVYLDPFPKSRSQQPLYQTPMWHLNTRPWLSIWNSSWRPDAHSERQQLASWLHAVDLQRLEDCLVDAGFSLWTLCRATPEELNACGITNPLDRQLLRTELNRVRVPDALPEKLPAGVKEWLSHLNLDLYWPGLRDQGFTSFERCAQLTWEDLEDVGVTKLGHQKKLLLAIERLQRQLRGCAVMLDPTDCRIQMAIPVDSTVSPLWSQKATFQHAGRDTTSAAQTPVLECRSTHGRSFSATNLLMEDETLSTPDCENDSSPVPAPPPAFRDSTPDQLGKQSISHPHSICVSRQRQAGERSVISLPPPVPPLRCSSMADNKDSPGLSSPYTKHHSLKMRDPQPFGRRGHSLLGHESRGSESDLFRNLSRRSSSPSLFQLNGDPQIPQLTKWASGQLVTPQLRLPANYQTVMDPELKDMSDIRAMLDALSEHLTSATQS